MHKHIKILSSLKLILLSLMLLFGNIAFAEETGDNYTQVTVSSINELENAVSNATTDTRITLNDGTYTSAATLSGNTGKVIVRGNSDHNVHFQNSIKISGNFITIRKCSFDGSNGGVNVYGNDVKLLRNIWDNSNSKDWIKINTSAYRTEVGWNLFQNRGSVTVGHQIIEQRVTDSTEKYETWVHHNHFKNIAASSGGSEIYLIYGQTTDTDDTPIYEPTCPPNDMFYEYNLFDNAKADGKFIDIKTNGVTARYNTITNGSIGYMTMRHSNKCVFHSNITTNGSSFWVTMSGADQKIYNNILTGKLYKEAIIIHSGTYDTSGPNGKNHQDVINAFIAFNTIIAPISNSHGIRIGSADTIDGGRTNAIPPKNSIIAHNLMIGTSGSMYTSHASMSELTGMTYDNNYYVDGASWSANAGSNNSGDGSMASVLTKLPSYSGMNLYDHFGNGVLIPNSGSSILNKGTAGSYSNITLDSHLTIRPAQKAVGANEIYDAGSTIDSVLTPTDVGVDAYASSSQVPDPTEDTTPTGAFIIQKGILR